MSMELAWKGALALVGCIAAAYIGQAVVGGGASGWIATGVILVATCGPLLKALYDRRKAR